MNPSTIMSTANMTKIEEQSISTDIASDSESYSFANEDQTAEFTLSPS